MDGGHRVEHRLPVPEVEKADAPGADDPEIEVGFPQEVLQHGPLARLLPQGASRLGSGGGPPAPEGVEEVAGLGALDDLQGPLRPLSTRLPPLARGAQDPLRTRPAPLSPRPPPLQRGERLHRVLVDGPLVPEVARPPGAAGE